MHDCRLKGNMSLAASPEYSAVDAAIPTEPVARFSVDQYHEMIRSGILSEGAPLELLDGWLVPKMTLNPPHSVATELLREALGSAVLQGWSIRVQQPLTLQTSEPESDAAVVRGGLRTYRDRHPAPEDTALVVEVADATLERDRTTKYRLYARAGIPVYWIVNLVDRQVEVHSDPTGPSGRPEYRQRRVYDASAELSTQIGEGRLAPLAVADLLP
jgi:Uma2 family endonuclease